MENYNWIVDKLKLSYGEVKQVGSEVIYFKDNFKFKLNVDINRLAETAKALTEQTKNKNGMPRKRRILIKRKL
jgi:hypothetical protein